MTANTHSSRVYSIFLTNQERICYSHGIYFGIVLNADDFINSCTICNSENSVKAEKGEYKGTDSVRNRIISSKK